MIEPVYDIDKAREYWKFAPSGFGKTDSSRLLDLDDREFGQAIYPVLQERYFYFWEDVPLINHFCEMFRGKKILAVGSGIGPEEIQYLKAGAQVTCADIVETNLRVVERTAQLEELDGFSYIHLKNHDTTPLPESIDYLYARGSLQTMPLEMQQKLLARIEKILAPGGRLIFGVYTKEFVEQTCSKEDPIDFARQSDPSVGECHNPWSEWYDDARVEALIGPDMFIQQRQTTYFDRNTWYVAARRADYPDAAEKPPTPLLDLEARERQINDPPFLRWDLSELQAGAASLEPDADGVMITTEANNYGYAAIFPPRDTTPEERPDKILVHADILEGGLNLGVLDADKDEFVFTKSIPALGDRREYFYLYTDRWPRRMQLIVSNFRPFDPEVSRFKLREIAFLRTSKSRAELKPYGVTFPTR